MPNRTFHLRCSFCGKEAIEVRKLITGPQVHICDECVTLCNEILAQDGQGEVNDSPDRRNLRPKDIKAYLDEHIVGQQAAKKALSVAVYNHYKRIDAPSDSEIELFKGNILMVGPTGCGKTAIAQALARLLDVPFVVADATCLTEAGYVGEDVESIIKSLWIAADRDVDRASRGIVVVDEIDKIARRAEGASSTRDVGGEGVQQALLKMIESDKVTIYPDGARTRPQKEIIQIDTTNILFILCGAFDGIDRVIQQRMSSSSIGFGADVKSKTKEQDFNQLIHHVRPEDFHKFGLIPEFVGRLPVQVPFEQLDEDALYEILWKPKNSLIRQYKRLFELESVSLRFTPEAMRAMVKSAIKRKSGARGLRSIIEEIMLDVMYELPSRDNVKECVISEEVVQRKQDPILVYESEEKWA